MKKLLTQEQELERKAKRSAYNKAYAAANKELIYAKNVRWRIENPEKHAATKAKCAKAKPEKYAETRLLWLQSNPERYASAKSNWQKNNQSKVAASSLNWRNENPDKYSAHTIVSSAVRSGTLSKAPCEICGNLKADAHHDDYSKPLEVRWLCRKHHKEWHKNNPSL